MKMIQEYWQMLIALVVVVSTFTTVQIRQDAVAEKVSRLESMQSDIVEIKLKVERIATKLEEQDKQRK